MHDIPPRSQVPVHTISEQKATVFDDRPDRDWLNPISLSILKMAVEKKAKTVYLNGIQFSIEYGVYLKMPVSGENRELIRLKRVDGEFTPYGCVSVKALQNFQFEE